MDISSKLTMSCLWEKKSTEDSDFLTPNFSRVQNIKCYKYGDIRNIRQGDVVDDMSDQTYLTKEKISIGDKLDGQVVRHVFLYPDFDGTIELYESHVLSPRG